MSDETKESLEAKEAVTDKKVTDAELDSASEVVEETKKLEVEAKEIEDELEEEPKDHKERSHLGRRVKRLEDGIDTLIDKMDGYFSQRNDDRSFPKKEAEDDNIPEMVATPDDVEKIIDNRERKKMKAQEDYENNYKNTTRSFQKQEGDSYKEIFDEMYENFNNVLTGNPKVDAHMNWLKAKNSVLSKKLSGLSDKKKLNLKGDKTSISTNLSVEGKIDETPVPDIQLDEYAADFVKRTKMKGDSVKDALKGEAGIHLSGRR